MSKPLRTEFVIASADGLRFVASPEGSKNVYWAGRAGAASYSHTEARKLAFELRTSGEQATLFPVD